MERLISRSKSLIKYFKYKKIIFAPWRADDVNDSPYHAWYLPLRKYCSNIIFFDPAKNYFKYGKRQMNDMLLSLVKKEKPDYIIFSLLYDEFNLRIFDEIRKISPDTLLINFFNDDDWRFNDFTLFYVTFFDYVITSVTSEDVKSFYKGISNVLFYSAVNCELFRPLSLNKKYDVTFVGRPNKSRVDYLIFLAENGVDIKIWGDGWASYPKLLRYYKGYLSAEDFPKVINESRINLSFSQGGYGKPQRKGRYYEASACRSFSLVEEYDAYRKYF
ncbi:MAG: hypothetical protein FJZ43_04330, partial [Candidatus Staskawiczbacteria bacterium]|nr:hypothetical protein [Candidatus Staskawiczbacteria bacterium]